ncbi:hypothetical protein DBV15_03616, partial [Temnothorax longispinosus]
TVSRALTQEIKRVTGERQRKAAANLLLTSFAVLLCARHAYGRSCTANARKTTTTTKRGRPTMSQHSCVKTDTFNRAKRNAQGGKNVGRETQRKIKLFTGDISHADTTDGHSVSA